jgi:hypothetical protein
MRTTIDLHDDLLRRAKVLAAESDRTLSEVVADALRVLLRHGEAAGPPEPLPVARFSRTVPGVDLTPRGLRDLIDDEDVERAGARR